MTYIFLAKHFSGYSGGPIYVRNKKRFLESKGWAVVAFASPQIAHQPIIIEELTIYEQNLYKEFYFHPSYYSSRELQHLINSVLEKIPRDSQYVVESNQPVLAEWGELIAEKLNASHIFFNINENTIIKDKGVYSFLNWKLMRNELFTISAKACVNLFSRYREVKDADKHFWRSAAVNDVSEVPVEDLDSLERADYNIGYFGRYKSFIPYMLKQVNAFAQQHSDKTVNLVILGFKSLEDNDKHLLSASNVNMLLMNPVSPIPKSFFDKTDVVIATAGCASISYKYGAKTISMSVEGNNSLGILGYTTNALSYSSGFDVDDRDLLQLLEAALVERSFDKRVDTAFLDVKSEDKYEQQLLALNKTPGYYDVCSHVPSSVNGSQKLVKVLVGLGLSKMVFNIKSIRVRVCG